MKKFSMVLVILLAFVLVLAACGGAKSPGASDKPDWVTNVSILTGDEAGEYYPLGVAMGNIIDANVEGVSATGLVSGASVVNIKELHEGQGEMALVQNVIAFYAQAGSHMFDEVYDGFSGVMTLYPEVIQIVTLANSGIVNIGDLVHKRVAVGVAGSESEANAKQILELHGIMYDEIRVEYISFADASTALFDGRVDAAFITAGTPTGAIQELSAESDIRIVNLDDSKITEIISQYPYYTKFDLSADTYGTAEGATTVTVQAMLIVRNDLPEDQVYEMTKAIFENLKVMQDTHARGFDVTLETAQDGMSIPLHAGAKRYYNEQK